MSKLSVEVLVLAKDEVENLITRKDAIEAAEIAFRAQGTKEQFFQPPNSHLFVDPPDNTKLILAMPSYIKPIEAAGIKWTNAYYQNQMPGIPAIWGGVVILNDPETGIPYAIIEATAITHMRTAGGHAAAAAKLLARKDSQKMAIIGCGTEGRAGLLAFSDLFPLEAVKVYDINSTATSSFIKDMSPQVSARIESSETPEEAFADADIIMTATWSEKPVLMEPNVPEGCFVAGLTRFKDVDPVLSQKADKWILGNRISDGNFNEPGIELSYDHVYADMGEIITGAKPGRENNRERILYTHMGMGAHDIALGHIAYSRAKERGIGTKVRLI